MTVIFCRFRNNLNSSPMNYVYENTFRQKTVGLFFRFGNNIYHSYIHHLYENRIRQKMFDFFYLLENNLNHSPMNYVQDNTITNKMVDSFCRFRNNLDIWPCILFEIHLDKKWSPHVVAMCITWSILPCIMFTRMRSDKNVLLILSLWD